MGPVNARLLQDVKLNHDEGIREERPGRFLSFGVQRKTEMHPITIVFAGMNDHLHSRGFLSRLREPTTAEDAAWPAIKDILESMGEVVDTLKEGAFTKITQ